MIDYISREEAVALAMDYCTDDDGSCPKAGHDLRELLDDLENAPPADVVPWEWLESYADMFCACWFSHTVAMDSYKVSYLNFIREAKRFYKATLAAMEGGHIGD